MKHLIRTSKRKLLNQLFFGNLIIALSVTVVMGSFLVTTSRRYIRNKFLSYNEAQLEQFSIHLENYFDRILKLPLSVNVQNKNIQNLFSLAYSGNYIDFNQSFNDFITLYADCDYIDSIWIYDGKDYVIDTKSGLRKTSVFESWERVGNMMNEAKKNYVYMVPYVSNPHESESALNVVSVVTPLRLSDAEYNDGCVVINVNMSVIMDNIYHKDDSNSGFYIFDKNSNTLISEQGNMSFSNDMQSIMLSENDETNFVFKKQKYNVNKEHSKLLPGYIYAFVNSYKDVSHETHSLILNFILTIIILLCVEIFISSWISRYIYHPLSQMFENLDLLFYRDKSDANDNNELSLLGKYMADMQENLNKKKQTISSYIPAMRRNAGHMIVEGEFTCEEEIISSLNDCGVKFGNGPYMTFQFMIDNWLNLLPELTDEELNTAKTAVFALIESETEQHFNCVSDIPFEDRIIIIADTGGLDINKELDVCFKNINDLIRLQMDTTISMVRSKPIDSVADIKQSVAQLQKLSDERFKYGSMSNIREMTCSLSTEKVNNLCIKRSACFMTAVSAGRENDAVSAVDSMIEDLKNMSNDSIRAAIFRFVSDLRAKYGDMPELDDIQCNIGKLIKYSDINELRMRFHNVIKILFSSASSPSNRVSEKIKEYINENYQKELSLQFLSDVFRLSPAYLSTLFKNSHGIGVVDYINKVRIDKAKELLRNSSVPIKDISDKVGFTNYNSFARVFKKTVGISAKDYKHNINL